MAHMHLESSPNRMNFNKNGNSKQCNHNFSHNNRCVFRVDNLVSGTCTSGQYYLRCDGKVCGDISVSLEYFPNHQSLQCLVEEVVGGGGGRRGKGSDLEAVRVRDPSLLMLLLGELVGMIRQSVRACSVM